MILNLFLSVFISSAAVSLLFLIYLAAEHVFRVQFNLRTKAFVLKGIVLLQPVFLLLMMLILISVTHFHGYSGTENASGTDSYQSGNNEFLTSDDSELSALSISSFSRGKGNKMSLSSVFSTLITPTTLTPITYAAYFWFIAALGLIARKSVAYSRFKRHILGRAIPVERCPKLHSSRYTVKPRIYLSKSVNSPFLIGCLKPVIILPSVDMDDFELYLVLRHECFHLKNLDIPFKFVLELLKSLNWFNPILGTVQKTYNQASEFVADDMVTEELSIAQRKTYGRLLLKFSESNIKNRPDAFSYLSEEAKHLADRLEAIMKMEKNKKINKCIVAFAIAVVATAVSVGAYITSDAYVSTAEAHSRISLIPEVGCIIFDDGKVQIFDGPEDETIPVASAPFDIGDSEDAGKEGDNARRTVLETGEYRTKAEEGDPIYSLAGGTVVSAKYEQGYGYCVTVEAEDGSLWKYAHCSKLLVDSGAHVSEGDVLSLAGKTGYAEQDSIFILRIKKEK